MLNINEEFNNKESFSQESSVFTQVIHPDPLRLKFPGAESEILL